MIPRAKVSQPFAYAHVTLVEGDQGQGKNFLMSARVVDATFANVTAVKLPNGVMVKATPLSPLDIGKARFWLPDRPSFVDKVPKGSCVIADDIHIYTNYHLYGIRMKYLHLYEIIEGLNEGYIADCYLLVDEHYIGGDARAGMSVLVRTFTEQGFQMRKRHVKLMMATPLQRLIDLRSRAIVTEHVICSYDDKKQTHSFVMKKKGERRYHTTPPIDAPPYWKYFNTDEQVPLPEGQVNKAIMGAI